MSVCGIIAEFNPFHNGHHALIQAARKAGAETICCVMSGNAVQRGSFAVTDKRVRAKAALECGADLIIELPLAHSVATAQRFARGAVFLLKATGCTDMLAFGSEAGSLDDLKTLSKAIDSPDVLAVMRQQLSGGVTFARARELAVQAAHGETLSVRLREPNNILGIEYLRQADLQGLKANAFTIKRVGVSHHGRTASSGFASASYLREHADLATLSRYVPDAATKIYRNAISAGLFPSVPAKLETAMLTHLRRLSLTELAMLPDVSEGLHNRMFASIREACTLCDLERRLKTKRYPMSRVRRLILCAFLGITAKDAETMPPYIRVLGFNAAGRRLLADMKQKCLLPFGTSLADLRNAGGLCERFALLEERATDLYALSLDKPFPCGYEYTAQAVFLRES